MSTTAPLAIGMGVRSGDRGAGSPQLVVLGTRGLSAWRPLRLGSTASAVVRAARCSALVACAPDETTEARGGGRLRLLPGTRLARWLGRRR